ncbi:MAG TPA: PEP-CTERM sorting domain-containing protein [Terriglobales bacterium]|nr:PEP-CTERM sorting domain-containing protein [Terriglobales bacterium]
MLRPIWGAFLLILVLASVGASASEFSYVVTGTYDNSTITDPNNVVIAGDAFSLEFSGMPSPLPSLTLNNVALAYEVGGSSISGLTAQVNFIPFSSSDPSTGLFDIFVSTFNGFAYEWGFTGAAAFDNSNFLIPLSNVPVDLDFSNIIVTNNGDNSFTQGFFQEGTVVNAGETPGEVPEPSSLLMLASGLVTTFGVIRCRR